MVSPTKVAWVWSQWCFTQCSICLLRCPWKPLAAVALVVALGFVGYTWNWDNHRGHTSLLHSGGALLLNDEDAGLWGDEHPIHQAHGTLDQGRSLEWYAQHSLPTDSGQVTNLKRVARFIIHLDKNAQDRWAPLIEAYEAELHEVDKYLREVAAMVALQLGTSVSRLESRLRALVEHFHQFSTSADSKYIGSSFLRSLMNELRAISALASIPVWRLMLLQLLYEASSHCTSVVAPRARDGVLLHARTLDSEQERWANMAVELDFRQGNVTLFEASSFPGYVGVLTGMRPGLFALSVNSRRPVYPAAGSTLHPILRAINFGRKGHLPASFAARAVLQRAKEYPTFISARRTLRRVPLVASVYFTISGVQANEGAILPRTPGACSPPVFLVSSGHIPSEAGTTAANVPLTEDDGAHDDDVEWSEVLVQTNTDFGDRNQDHNIFNSFRRREQAEKFFQDEHHNYKVRSAAELWRLMYSAPIFSESTLFITVMNVHEKLYETRSRAA